MANPKMFLYEWCSKNALPPPQFEVKETGPASSRIRFTCMVSVTGHGYVGKGGGTSKKSCQRDASHDFLTYLVHHGLLPNKSIQASWMNGGPAAVGVPDNSSMTNVPSRSMDNVRQESADQLGPSPGTSEEVLQRPNGKTDFLNGKSKVQKVKHFNENVAVHGNWTVNNAQKRLNQFVQCNNLQKIHYNYTIQNKNYVAELTLNGPTLGEGVVARETALTKSTASRNCAQSLIRQLYHLDIIEAYSGYKKKTSFPTEPYKVNVDPILMSKVHDVLQELNIEPVINNDTVVDRKIPISLISNQVLAEFNTDSEPTQLTGVIPWSPPQPHWNAWLGSQIDNSSVTPATMGEISTELMSDYHYKRYLHEGSKESVLRSQLPIFAKKKEILDAVTHYSVVLIQGSTGCGKTTQVCQFILDEYLESDQGAYCNIICTQTKKISAISVCDRVASERIEAIGTSVGYSVRFDSMLPRPYGAILFCTVGTLLRRLEKGVHGISHIIVDEVHERDKNSDFLLVALKDMVNRFRDLRVILMSATINTEMFSRYFNHCPVINVVGNSYPVKEYFLEDIVQMLNYQPPTPDVPKCKINNKVEEPFIDYKENCNLIVSDDYPPDVQGKVAMISEKDDHFEIVEALLRHIDTEMNVPGAVLIFLPGWNSIFALQKYLTEIPLFASSKYCILSLHSQVAYEDQHQVFHPVPYGVRKVILSTNIAETSVTINDVVFVINYGKSKVKLFTTHNQTTRYSTIWTSKANMQQRKGRAGRVAPGFCFNLYTKARFNKLNDYVIPEIFYMPLHVMALHIKLLKLGDVRLFFSKTVEPPPIDAVNNAITILKEIKCFDENEKLTSLGRILAKLPVDPYIGRMMVLGNVLMLGDALAVIAAICSNMTDLFVYDRTHVDALRAFSGNRCSDHLTALNVFHQWREMRSQLNIYTNNPFDQGMVSLPILMTTARISVQIIETFIKFGFPKICFKEQMFDFGKSAVHDEPMLDVVSAILTMGFYPNVCYRVDKRKVLTADKMAAIINSKSVNYNNTPGSNHPPFFLFTEKVHGKFVNCKQMSMVSPIHLLLFGARKIEYSNNVVKLDNWINLKMDARSASAIVALRPAIESLIIKVSVAPESISSLSEVDNKLIEVLRELCSFNSGRFNLSPVSFNQGNVPNQMSGQSGYASEPEQFKDEGGHNTDKSGVGSVIAVERDQQRSNYIGGPTEKGHEGFSGDNGGLD